MRPPPQVSQPETELQEFFDLSIDLLCIVGFDGCFKRVNRAFERALGYPDLLARSALDVTHPDDVEPSREALAQLAEGRDMVGFESRIIGADGMVRWIEWNTRTMPERGVVYGVGRDTTERRRVEGELREARSMLEASRDELSVLAEEQAALRRVATAVARGGPRDELFAVVGREVAALLGADGARVVRYAGDEVDQLAGWSAPEYGPISPGRVQRVDGTVTDTVFRTGRPARADDRRGDAGPLQGQARIRSIVGAPISVEGRLWGAVIAWWIRQARLPETAEARLAGFTELVATAALNSAKRAELDRLLAEQAALRRVATLVARELPPDAVLAAVGREVGELLGVDAVHVGRYDADGTVVSVAQWGRSAGIPVRARYPLEGESVSARVLRSGQPARMDGYAHAPGVIAETVREIGIGFSIGVPISVAGRTWGVLIVSSEEPGRCPPDTESRLHDFTELVAAAVSNATAHASVRALADEQAALRRVATLVAKQTPQREVFRAVAEEIGRLLGVDSIEMVRYEEDRFAAIVATAGALADATPIGMRMPLEGRDVASLVFRTGCAARVDEKEATGAIAERLFAAGARSVAGAPIMVEGKRWGAVLAVARDTPLPPDTEARIGQFTELMATAIANAEARAEVRRLADEQAALRRVATLVAQGASARAVFDAVTAEVSELLGAEAVSLARYDDDAMLILAHRATRTIVGVGQRMPMEPADLAAIVRRTGQTARSDEPPKGTGPGAGVLRRGGVHSTVAVPIVVDGRTWGVMGAFWPQGSPPPEDTEERMARFAELLDTAIANADSRDQLTASRARVLAAGDDARRRVVRDLHDGAQQRLVHCIVTLKLAAQALREHRANGEALLDEALEHAEGAIADLRELSHGILPVGLMRGGLSAALDAFVSRLELPVDVDVSIGRLPSDIEASAYFIVAEALTNVIKHARATRAAVRATVDERGLCVEVRDDGVGGADPEGFGLVGIADRVDALGGELQIETANRGGTVIVARLPLST